MKSAPSIGKQTQLWIRRHRRSVKQGSWRWQKRGCESLVAWPAVLGTAMPDLHCSYVRESNRRSGALDAATGSNVIQPFCRKDAEKIFGPLVPGIGGEFGPWLTVTPVF